MRDGRRGAGLGRDGSLTGRRGRAGGRRQLLQEAHGHFQYVRLLQLRVAGALRPATRESRDTDERDTSPAPAPLRLGLLRHAEPGRRLLGRGPLKPPVLLTLRPGAPTPAPERPGTHLPAQQRQDEPLELPEACVDARAAALLQQRLQALRTGPRLRLRGSQARSPPGLSALTPQLLPCAAPPGPRLSEAAPCSAGNRRGCGARVRETCARADTERRPGPEGMSRALQERAPEGCAPRQPPGFKEAVSPAPPRPIPPHRVWQPAGPTSRLCSLAG